MAIQKIKFLRGTTVEANYTAALTKLGTLNLEYGEPVVIRYTEGTSTKMLMAVGNSEGNTPLATVDNINEVKALITSAGGDLTKLTTRVTALETTVGSVTSGLVKGLADVKITADAAAPKATTYTKTEVDTAISSGIVGLYKIKGSVANAAALLALTGVKSGWVYNIIAAGIINTEAFEAGSNFVATIDNPTAAQWDKLGGTIDLSGYLSAEAIAALYATKTQVATDIAAAKTAAISSAKTYTDTEIVKVNTTVTGVGTRVTAIESSYVPNTRKVNGKALGVDIVLSGADVKTVKVVGPNATNTAIDDVLVNLDARISAAVSGGVTSIVGGNGVNVDVTDVNNPIVSLKTDTAIFGFNATSKVLELKAVDGGEF